MTPTQRKARALAPAEKYESLTVELPIQLVRTLLDYDDEYHEARQQITEAAERLRDKGVIPK